MKQKLLLVIFLLISVFSFAQVEGPPPPCGYNSYYVCEDNFDGIATFNLVDLFPFHFCNTEDPINYGDLLYYETVEDMDNETNPIINPESYTNISNPQNIFYRANAITPEAQYEVLKSTNSFIEVLSKPTPSQQNTLVLCDVNGNGINTFNLTSINETILAGLDSNIYNLRYYESLSDAENDINSIESKSSYTNTSNPQKLYVNVGYYSDLTCNDIVELDLIVKDDCKDVAVYLTSIESPRPGFNYRNYLTVKNLGANPITSGNLEFVYDSVLDFIQVTEVDSGNSITTTSTGFVLNFFNLEPNAIERINIKMNVPIPTPLGTLLTNTATYSVNDLNAENNASTLSEIVIGSYDPNDIAESHGPEILHESFNSEDYLYYTVRFQNVGTADAINVSIDNTLDSRLDKSTIEMLSSSHNNVFTRTDNQLNWQFDDIHLPSEDMDEPASHGYVYYKIKPTTGYAVGDIIPNTAEIYFDFNPAVITNTFETEFTEEETLSNTYFNNTDFSVFPNPTSNYISLNFYKNNNDSIKINIYDIQGKMVYSASNEITESSLKLNVSDLSKGLYFLKVNDGHSETAKKFIIK